MKHKQCPSLGLMPFYYMVLTVTMFLQGLEVPGPLQISRWGPGNVQGKLKESDLHSLAGDPPLVPEHCRMLQEW